MLAAFVESGGNFSRWNDCLAQPIANLIGMGNHETRPAWRRKNPYARPVPHPCDPNHLEIGHVCGRKYVGSAGDSDFKEMPILRIADRVNAAAGQDVREVAGRPHRRNRADRPYRSIRHSRIDSEPAHKHARQTLQHPKRYDELEGPSKAGRGSHRVGQPWTAPAAPPEPCGGVLRE